MNKLLHWFLAAVGLMAWYFVTSSSPLPQPQALPQPNANTAVTGRVYHGPYATKAKCAKEQAKYDNVILPCHEEDDPGGS